MTGRQSFFGQSLARLPKSWEPAANQLPADPRLCSLLRISAAQSVSSGDIRFPCHLQSGVGLELPAFIGQELAFGLVAGGNRHVCEQGFKQSYANVKIH